MRKRTVFATLAPAAAGLGVSALVWQRMPDPMPIHWDAHGMPDGWAPKAVGLLCAPLVGALAAGLAAWAVRRGTAHRGIVDGGAGGVGAFFLGLHALVIQAALQPDGRFALGGLFALVGALFVGLGLAMPHLSPNRFAGVRTPWTLRDEVSWKLTHRFAAWSMGLAGALTVALALTLPPPALSWAALAVTLTGALLPVGYSYVLHRLRR